VFLRSALQEGLRKRGGHLFSKMRFVAGPRQSGKTTLARTILAGRGSPDRLFNWDAPETRRRYRQDTLFYREAVKGLRKPWVCFDEIHKQRQWKNILKGIYDVDGERMRILVTGSARLELFRRAGDSLAGRFFRYWLAHLPEIAPVDVASLPPGNDFQDLERSNEGHILLDNRYALLEPIGEGGMGRVFLASDRLLRTPVAIKILRPELSDDPQILERFRREIILSRDLGHPNVLRIYHLGQDQSRRYLTMQWVEGQTLGQLLAETGALTESQVLKIAIKLTSALEAAHGRGVLHRDVKPQNVMLDGESEPFLTDFGLARELNDPGITSAGMFLGTPNYVSPEQASAHPLDERSDLYSFGVVLFEMATGRRPFEAEGAAEMLRRHRDTPPPDPRSLAPDLSLGLSSIILRCLAKSPDDRFDSATQLRQALEALNTAPDRSLA